VITALQHIWERHLGLQKGPHADCLIDTFRQRQRFEAVTAVQHGFESVYQNQLKRAEDDPPDFRDPTEQTLYRIQAQDTADLQ
jgi:hypothetical protein